MPAISAPVTDPNTDRATAADPERLSGRGEEDARRRGPRQAGRRRQDEPAPLRRVTVFASFSGTGGVERMLVHLIEGFVAEGRAVDLLLIRTDSALLARLPPAVRQIRLPGRHSLLAVVPLARWLRRHRPPALLAAKDRAGRAAVLARALAGVETRLVLRLGTNLSAAQAGASRLARWLRRTPIRLLYRRVERIVAVSDGVAADTAAIARLPPARIEVIRNPVITPALQQQAHAPCPHPWLRSHERRGPVLLAAGRLQQQKDFPTLLRAFARLPPARGCRLLILGEGRARSGLEALCAELGLALGVHGSVDLPGYRHDLYGWLARADLFVLSSAWEGSPNVLTEALALGVPAVATDCPSGPREILAGGRYGRLVPVGDAGALAAAITATLDAPLDPATLKRAVAGYERGTSARAYLRALEGDRPRRSRPPAPQTGLG